MLGTELHALGLQHLADIEQRGKILRLGYVPQQVIVDETVANPGSSDARASPA